MLKAIKQARAALHQGALGPHVVQQGPGAAGPATSGEPDLERDADQAIHTASQAAERDDSYGVERELVHLWIYDLRSRTIALEADQCGGVQAQLSSR